MSTQPVTPPPSTLATMVRGKYPGVYDDISDSDLEQKVLAKYPEYSDIPTTQAAPPKPTASVSKAPGGVGGYLSSLEGDVKYGSQNTLLGKMLHGMGAQGTQVGAQAGAGDTLASPITGPIHTAQGVSQMGQHPFLGALKALGGLAETASIPAAFMAPEAAESAAAAPSKVTGRAAIDSASQAFQKVMGLAKDQPVPMTDNLSQSLSRYQDLVNAGGSRSLSVSKLLNRVTAPNAAPLSYSEARDFASNISRLSADETQRLTPVMRLQVGNIKAALNEAVGQAAGSAGQGSQYAGAMQNYAGGMRRQENVSEIVDLLKKGAMSAVGGGIAGYGIQKGMKAAGLTK